MNGLPRLLQRLGVFAHSRDARGVRETLDYLARNTGWDADVVRYITRLDGLDRSFVDNIINPPPAAEILPPSGMNERSMGIMGSQPIAVPITKDATSGILTPANRAEWDQVMVYAGISSGGPSFVYQMQEASGNLLDSIGGATLTVAGAPSYRQAVAGWSRLAFTFADGGATIASRSTAPIMDTGTTSQLILLYGFAASATVNRSVAILGNPTQQIYGVTTTTFRAVSSTTATGAAALSSAVRPMVLLSDVTAGRCVGYNESDKMVPTYRAGAGINLAFNSNYTGGNLYAACFQQGAAELTDAQIKRLLQTLGWTITWT